MRLLLGMIVDFDQLSADLKLAQTRVASDDPAWSALTRLRVEFAALRAMDYKGTSLISALRVSYPEIFEPEQMRHYHQHAKRQLTGAMAAANDHTLLDDERGGQE